jgi:hypothetical protein
MDVDLPIPIAIYFAAEGAFTSKEGVAIPPSVRAKNPADAQ